MRSFNCLARDCPLLGPHLLEASAGTGKTFSIEHIFVRLILEGIDGEQILAVTFTRAATRELKARIRSNLEKALQFLKKKDPAWDYLVPFFDAKPPICTLQDALATFDRCQIFTIHGFCARILQEFAFEAKVGPLANSNEGKKVSEKLRHAAIDFLENGIDRTLLCPEQVSLLFKQFDSFDEIVDRLLKMEEVDATLSFSEVFSKCKAALHPWNLEEEKIFHDFYALKPNYKTQIKGDFEGQIRGLIDEKMFPLLLKERGTLFDFFSPHQRKVKAQSPSFLYYPGFFDWARIHIDPLVKEKVFPILQNQWNLIAKKLLLEEEIFDPDEILAKMKTAIEDDRFANLVRQKYAAAIIDEFQDTDPVQWEIFQKLFFNDAIKAVYLVGDPKQAIYRFRKADVYTYLKARDYLGENHLYHLDTNFRSSKEMINALNLLFSRNWLHLPKVNRSLPYSPVTAGANIDSDLGDEKGAIHFLIADEKSQVFEEQFLPYAAQEIIRLKLWDAALLVKDRYQAQKALEYFKKLGIEAVAKSHIPLGKTAAFQSICELIDAILSPQSLSSYHLVMSGPFAQKLLCLSEWKTLLEEKGLISLAKNLPLDADGIQIFEYLFAWEKKEGFSFFGLKRALEELRKMDVDEGARRPIEVKRQAVQIMTMHISKGLEFDVVFALGLASRTPESKEVEESDAEKLRQLYVAMTRAKKRLYVPIILNSKEPTAGTHSPIELFSRYFEKNWIEELEVLAKSSAITIEKIGTIIPTNPFDAEKKESAKSILRSRPASYAPSFISSFTSLAKAHEFLPQTDFEAEAVLSEPNPSEFTMQNLPKGAGTGIVIHRIFESLFSAKKPIWRIPSSRDQIVEEQLAATAFAPWKGAVQDMVHQILQLPLQTKEGDFFTLMEIDQCQVEMEFIYATHPHFVKGFIDLVFYHSNRVYFLDWKTNFLQDYSSPFLEAVMKANEYTLQASIYTEAIQRHFQKPFGGAYYVFVRGGTYCRM